MKNKLLSFALLLVLISVHGLFGQDSKINIAVLDLDPTGIAKPDAEFLSHRLRTELFETGQFQVIEREKMNEILTEQGFQQSGCTSVECAVEIGQLLNVAVMTAGNIGKIEDLYSISVRMIDVKTGAIIKTATQDFEGKLSEVLTDVIPEIASELASYEVNKGLVSQQTHDNEQKQESSTAQETGSFRRFGVVLLGGFSTLTYTTKLNEEIQEVNAYIAPDIDEFSGHYLLGVELRYTFSQRWQLKLGFVGENMLSHWQASTTISSLPGGAVERKNRFVNSYLGLNYAIWNSPGNHDIYIGADLGSTSYSSDLIYSYTSLDGTNFEDSKTYEYTSFTFKFAVGGTYFVSKVVSLGVSIIFKSVQPYDTSDQSFSTDFDFPEELIPFLLPEEINASGIQFTFYLGFHF